VEKICTGALKHVLNGHSQREHRFGMCHPAVEGEKITKNKSRDREKTEVGGLEGVAMGGLGRGGGGRIIAEKVVVAEG